MCWLQPSAQLWHLPTFLLWPLLLIACLECFAGYHAWRLLLGVSGAALGLVLGALVSIWMGATLLVLLGALAGALAGAFFFAGIPPLGSSVFAFGSVASFLILLGRVAGFPSHFYLPVALAAGLGGIVAVLTLRRPARITLAAVAGAQQIAAAWSAYHLPASSNPCPETLIPTEWLLFCILAAIGLLVQFATSRPAPNPLLR
jgi:hypothetical protein